MSFWYQYILHEEAFKKVDEKFLCLNKLRLKKITLKRLILVLIYGTRSYNLDQSGLEYIQRQILGPFPRL